MLSGFHFTIQPCTQLRVSSLFPCAAQSRLVLLSLYPPAPPPSHVQNLSAAHTPRAHPLYSCAQAADTSVQNASLNASFASVMENGLGLGGGGGGTPNRSFASMRSAVRAAIPKNFVKDRARAIEGIPLMGDMDADGSGDRKKADPASSGEIKIG